MAAAFDAATFDAAAFDAGSYFPSAPSFRACSDATSTWVARLEGHTPFGPWFADLRYITVHISILGVDLALCDLLLDSPL